MTDRRSSGGDESVPLKGGVMVVGARRAALPGGSVSATVNAVNRAQIAAWVNALPELRECRARILWLDESAAYPYAGKLGESLVVYDCVDEDWRYARSPLTRRFLVGCEKKVTAAADVVFASSRTLFERKRAENPETHWVPNGVDFEHFSRAALSHPPAAASGGAPRLCVLGHTMPQRTDFPMLLEAARRRPEWRVTLIGRVEWPQGEPVPANFELLGHRPFEELPDLLAQTDVCLIPYRLEGPLSYVHPKKLHEYLAAGKPVVATPLAEIVPFEGIVKTARTAAELVEKVEECLRENADPIRSAQLVQERQAVARENTWDQRVAQMIAILERHLSGP